MKKENLHRRIMEGLKSEIFNALNEEFQFDDTEVTDKLLEIVRKDKQIQKVVANATANDWISVLRGMVKLIKNNNIPENPTKIANIVQLASAFLQRGIDSKLQEKMKEFTFDDMQYTSNFMVKEIAKFVKPEKVNTKTTDNTDNSKNDNANESCGNKSNESCANENKSVCEARNYKRTSGGKFSKYLNENKINLRPGKK